MTLDEALSSRVSVRSFKPDELSAEQVMRLAWAARGYGTVDATTGATRTAPSAGATDPVEVLVLQGGALSRYAPGSNSMEPLAESVSAGDVAGAAGQPFIASAPALFVIAVDPARTEAKYGDRAERYLAMEAGHTAQNLLLEATSLGLGSVPVGAFDDAGVAGALKLPPDLEPLYLLPVGYPR